ncbi:MAG: fructosamine kinase family protein [Phycisphaerales bacterium JB063]
MNINYNRGMSERGEFVTPEIATGLVQRHLNPDAIVTTVRKLYGGSNNRVLELILDRGRGSVVAKVNDHSVAHQLEAERDALAYFREHTTLPVPKPLGLIVSDPGFTGVMLMMEKIPGTTLERAKINAGGMQRFEHQLGHHIADLHRHTSDYFGPAAGATAEQRFGTWLDLYGPIVEREANGARSMLESACRDVVDHVAKHLAYWLDHDPKPTLIHGDLWANNIMVDDGNPGRPRINAYIDGHASFADREYELSYLRLFKTAGPYFFNIYRQHHREREGFERRCRVYWLTTMLQHCRVFGGKYIPTCERIAHELRRLR